MTYNFIGFIQAAKYTLDKHVGSETMPSVLKYFCKLLYRFNDFEQQIAFKEFQKSYKIPQSLLKQYAKFNYTEDEEDYEQSNARKNYNAFCEFMQDYRLEYDEMSGKLTAFYANGKPLNDIADIEAKAIFEGLKDARYYLKLVSKPDSEYSLCKKVNPLKDFFEQVAKKYKGENVIKQLASLIPAYNFGNTEATEHYQKRVYYYLHKWLCLTVGQALGLAKNDGMLLFIDPVGGSGKTELIHWLGRSSLLANYYLFIGNKKSYIDFGKISSQYLMMNFDEMPLTLTRYNEFKSTLGSTQNNDFEAKKGYKKSFRIMSMCGSTNLGNRNSRPGYLLDNDDAVKRRIIPIEIEGRINYMHYLKNIDWEQIWAQAAYDFLDAYTQGNKQLITYECDWADLREENNKYVNVEFLEQSDPLELIKKILPASELDNGRLLSATEIIQELTKETTIKLRINKHSLGRKMKQSGYNSGHNHLKRGWWIKN